MSKMLKSGSKGDAVTALQKQLVTLGYAIKTDGDFGPATEKAVVALQGAFGYTTDGIVGPGTQGLIDAQIGYGWNANAPDAFEKAQKAQGKTVAAPVDKAAMAAKPAAAAPAKGAAPAAAPAKTPAKK
jgi:peptidoglycan hydrolase-like protein with peptidoglycan-binding domain